MVVVHLDLRKVAGVFGKPNGNLVPFWRALDSGATGKVSTFFSLIYCQVEVVNIVKFQQRNLRHYQLSLICV